MAMLGDVYVIYTRNANVFVFMPVNVTKFGKRTFP